MKKLYRFRKCSDRPYYQVMFFYRPGKWLSTNTDDFAEAVVFAEQYMKTDLYGGVTKDNITFREFATDFYKESDPHNIRKKDKQYKRNFNAKYYSVKQSLLDRYIMPKFGSYTLSAITTPAIESWFFGLKLLFGKRVGEDMSDDCKNKILLVLRSILDVAVNENYLTDNPASRVSLINAEHLARETFSKEEIAAMFPEEDAKLVLIWTNLMWSTFFLIAKDTGWRPGEISALTIDNYYPEYHGVYTNNSINNFTRELQTRIKTTGKGLDYKVGLLTEQTERFVGMLIEECKAQNRTFLFMINNKYVASKNSNQHFIFGAKRAGVELRGRSQYCLRHSFETDVAGTVENKVLAELMAHTAYNPTYDHRTPERILEQLQPFREILEKRKGGN